jgi:NAD(P)-dependent dehydrogenase (short-subunit alcohol dehydrogenase family)
MQIEGGQVAVVTGAGSGIGRALAERFAAAGCHVVLADIDEADMAETAARCEAAGAETLSVPTDVSKEASVNALASAAIDAFGSVRIVCNNAGVASRGDPWFGPISQWEWTFGVNVYGVVHGIRAFLPHLAMGGGGHIVNTASIAGLMPGFGASYDASKHAVVALSEDLYLELQNANLGISVSVLCPGWVRTNIIDADRHWPTELGERPVLDPVRETITHHVRRAVDEGLTPAAAADAVFDAVVADRFWVLPQPDFFELVVRRFERIAEQLDPEAPEAVPGMPPRAQIMREVEELMAQLGAGGGGSGG